LSSEKERAATTVNTYYTENFVKFGHVVLEMLEQTDRQTDTLIAILATHTGVEINKNATIGT